MQMLTGNANVVLANLDWLMLHLDMKLDYAAGVVRDKNGEPEFLLADLGMAGLTPATAVELIEGYASAKRALGTVDGIRPHMSHSPEDLKRMEQIARDLPPLRPGGL